MEASSDRIEANKWITTVFLSVVVPVALFAAFMFVSRFALRSLYGRGDFPALFLCAAAGIVPIFRSRYSTLAKVGLAVAYICVFVTVVGMSAWWFDCLVLHDCD